MRYVSLAYGTRQEILAELRNNLGGQRSERRQREAVEAIRDLENGETSVTFGHTTYLVEE